MEKDHVVAALAALAQDNRLDVFRLLVKAGPEGLAAGQVAKALGIPPNTLTFHFDRLRQAGLIAVRRESRSMIYTAQFETMHGLVGFLTENCCAGVADECGPSCATPASTSKTQSKTQSKIEAKKHEPAR
jgi:ArsR family transcriptional regulator